MKFLWIARPICQEPKKLPYKIPYFDHWEVLHSLYLPEASPLRTIIEDKEVETSALSKKTNEGKLKRVIRNSTEENQVIFCREPSDH